MLTLFEPKKTKTEKTHFRNLIALAKADGELSQEELELIHKIGETRGFDQEEIESLLEEDASSIDLRVPDNDTERFDQIFELVQIMLADGKIADAEMDFCIDIAEKLGFSIAFAGVVVNKIAMNLSNNASKEFTKAEMESFLSF